MHVVQQEREEENRIEREGEK